MAVEARRGCGFRKVGGLYLRADGPGRQCGRFPIPLPYCPHCQQGVKVGRSLRFLDAAVLLSRMGQCKCEGTDAVGYRTISLAAGCDGCPLQYAEQLGTVAVLGVGERYYPRPSDFTREAAQLGISKRIAQIPKQLKLGETWIFFSHSKAIAEDAAEAGNPLAMERTWKPGLFYAFKPSYIELMVSPTWKAKHAKRVERLVKRGVRLVEVPDDDPDHT